MSADIDRRLAQVTKLICAIPPVFKDESDRIEFLKRAERIVFWKYWDAMNAIGDAWLLVDPKAETSRLRRKGEALERRLNRDAGLRERRQLQVSVAKARGDETRAKVLKALRHVQDAPQHEWASRIARKTGFSDRTVRRHLAAL